MCRRKTQEEFEKEVKELYGDKFSVVGKYKDYRTGVDIKCNRCGYTINRTPNSMQKGGTSCPICEPEKVTREIVIGVNDMWSTNPEVAELLANPQDGYKYRVQSNKKLLFKCPICKHTKEINPNHVLRSGSISCNYCSNGISYPNRFMANLLDLLKIKFIPEFHFDNSDYKYDFYFCLNNVNYLIEMDGAFGHGCWDTPNRTIEEQLIIDAEKDKLATKMNYVLIRIDCKYTDMNTRSEYIINNIKSSVLNQLFNITDENYIEAEKIASKNDYVKFADLWNAKMYSYEKLSQELHVVARSTIRRYAKRCIELGLIDETYDSFKQKVRLASNKKLAHTKGKPVMCVQTGEIFYSISEAERRKNITNLSKILSHGDGYCGYLPNGEKAQWVYI